MINIETANSITSVTIQRAEAKNALNADLIKSLTDTFSRLAVDDDTRVIILTGEGDTFSAGADINYMKQLGKLSEKENKSDAENLSNLFRTVSDCPKPVIGKINGAAFGGGVGLVSVCDLAIAVISAKFSFSEVRLGLLPATISPFVLRKIGYSYARLYFLSGAVFSSAKAKEIGLIHELSDNSDDLDNKTTQWAEQFKKCSPQAISAVKPMIDRVQSDPFGKGTFEYTADLISKTRSGKEAQEGLRAFLEKRKPSWAK